jgi:hypothetical protein
VTPGDPAAAPSSGRRWVGVARVALPGALLIAAVCTAGLLVGGLAGMGPEPSAVSSTPERDLDGRAVRADAGSTPRAEASARTSIGVRLTVPAVGLDVPVGAISSVAGVVTPPGFRSAYWVRDRGAPLDRPERGTVVVVMHALGGGGRGPGNAMVGGDGSVRVHAGDEIRVGDHRYRVTGSHTVRKSHLDADALWRDEPGRLLVVTCLPRASGGAATRNVLVSAALVSEGS